MPEKNIVLNHSDIIELIPHREPFLFVDSVDNIVLNESARGIKAITGDEAYFAGHFPEFPIMPGVLIVEAIAQTAAIFLAYSNKENSKDRLVFFRTIDNVKFRIPVRPGDTLHIDVKLITQRNAVFKCEGVVSVDGKTVASAQIGAMMVEPGR